MTGARPWAVVTGASSGIGAWLARGLAARGHPVWVVARRGDALDELAAELTDRTGVDVRVSVRDLADPVARDALCEELAAEPVAVLCANAGFPVCGPVTDNDAAREAACVEVNAVALHALTLAVLPGMTARGRGRILVSGSTAGYQPVPTAATYAATKAFANTFAESLHAELRGTGVSCTLLAPGPVRTDFYRVGGVPGLTDQKLLAWQSPQYVAEAGLRAMERGRRLSVPGPVAKAQYVVGRHLPRTVLAATLRGTILPRLRGARAPRTAEPSARAR
ncbi:SDR family NAD(P)-dependent oxidoreductase [Streptomyces sp. NPDC127068]|uniref:SDR family NAD(P)-dependent oxidoreductase n=1 Tax=Streptomyces sp. NPDC127068 TaxID=3347127 RepID=UPI003650A7F0